MLFVQCNPLMTDVYSGLVLCCFGFVYGCFSCLWQILCCLQVTWIHSTGIFFIWLKINLNFKHFKLEKAGTEFLKDFDTYSNFFRWRSLMQHAFCKEFFAFVYFRRRRFLTTHQNFSKWPSSVTIMLKTKVMVGLSAQCYQQGKTKYRGIDFLHIF